MPIKVENNQITVLNPASLKEVGKVNLSTKQDVDNALKIAKEYNGWSSLTLNKRCKIINKFRKIVLKHSNQIKEIIKNETGKKDFVVFVEFFAFLDHAKTMSKIAKTALKKSKR